VHPPGPVQRQQHVCQECSVFLLQQHGEAANNAVADLEQLDVGLGGVSRLAVGQARGSGHSLAA
jgi:predicted dithiol-disulfide oxidoreductase (DUF899 family)